jgi:hypothetical protein
MKPILNPTVKVSLVPMAAKWAVDVGVIRLTLFIYTYKIDSPSNTSRLICPPSLI